MGQSDLEDLSDRAIINMSLESLLEMLKSENGNPLEIIGEILSGFFDVVNDDSICLKKLGKYMDKIELLFIGIRERPDVSVQDIRRYERTYQQIIEDYVPYALRNRKNGRHVHFQLSRKRDEKYYHEKVPINVFREDRGISDVYGEGR